MAEAGSTAYEFFKKKLNRVIETVRRKITREPSSENEGGVDSGDRKIGKLRITLTQIGKGSNGTIVFRGFYDGRPAAVKRLVRGHHDEQINEVDHLIASDRHENIVRYYGKESDDDFVYLALELCSCNLNDLIQALSASSNKSIFPDEYKIKLDSLKATMQDVNLWRADGSPSTLLLKLMRDVVSGVAHLHGLDIIHRDLKPQNVLITKNQSLVKNQTLVARLSDMGISKCLPKDKSSLGEHDTGCGSSGWRAPEQLNHGGSQTLAMDLFSLGCVLFFCVTRGSHPFGESIERDINIKNNKMDLSSVESIPEAHDLIFDLLNPLQKSRPKASVVLQHPIFWDSKRRLSFLCDISDTVQSDAAPNLRLLKDLNSKAPLIFNEKWNIATEVMDHLGKRRKYDDSCLKVDLLRVVRNLSIHHKDLPEKVEMIIGRYPLGLDAYFAARFPRLLIESYKVVSESYKQEEPFREYFQNDAQSEMCCGRISHLSL